jgi:hypothetical protein
MEGLRIRSVRDKEQNEHAWGYECGRWLCQFCDRNSNLVPVTPDLTGESCCGPYSDGRWIVARETRSSVRMVLEKLKQHSWDWCIANTTDSCRGKICYWDLRHDVESTGEDHIHERLTCVLLHGLQLPLPGRLSAVAFVSCVLRQLEASEFVYFARLLKWLAKSRSFKNMRDIRIPEAQPGTANHSSERVLSGRTRDDATREECVVTDRCKSGSSARVEFWTAVHSIRS